MGSLHFCLSVNLVTTRVTVVRSVNKRINMIFQFSKSLPIFLPESINQIMARWTRIAKFTFQVVLEMVSFNFTDIYRIYFIYAHNIGRSLSSMHTYFVCVFLTQKCEWTEFPYENQVFNARGTCHIYFHTHLSTSKSFASQVMFVYILPFGKSLLTDHSSVSANQLAKLCDQKKITN